MRTRLPAEVHTSSWRRSVMDPDSSSAPDPDPGALASFGLGVLHARALQPMQAVGIPMAYDD